LGKQHAIARESIQFPLLGILGKNTAKCMNRNEGLLIIDEIALLKTAVRIVDY